jgi:hypothetical protein
MMYLKIHESRAGRIVAACDSELIGKVLEEKGACLDLDRYRSFYVGRKAGEAELKDALRAFGSANIVGDRCVKVVLDMGLTSEEDVMYIKKIPYIQLYRI